MTSPGLPLGYSAAFFTKLPLNLQNNFQRPCSVMWYQLQIILTMRLNIFLKLLFFFVVVVVCFFVFFFSSLSFLATLWHMEFQGKGFDPNCSCSNGGFLTH